MHIGLKYQGYGASDNDVWTMNSYYRISDERGQKKKKNASVVKCLVFAYFCVQGCIFAKGGAGRGLSRLDLTVGRFFFLLFGKMSSGWETVEIN